MATVFDAAKYILMQTGPISAMKLQKLLYYAQAWSLVWEEKPLFKEDFQAWANGPVVRELYARHKGMFEVGRDLVEDANANRFNDEQKDTIQRIIAAYGKKSAHQLSVLTHSERPWREARGQTPPMEPCEAVISKGSMHEFYSSL